VSGGGDLSAANRGPDGEIRIEEDEVGVCSHGQGSSLLAEPENPRWVLSDEREGFRQGKVCEPDRVPHGLVQREGRPGEGSAREPDLAILQANLPAPQVVGPVRHPGSGGRVAHQAQAMELPAPAKELRHKADERGMDVDPVADQLDRGA